MEQITHRTTIFGSIQWMFFIFANIIVVPISIGIAFELTPEQTATILRSSLIVTGGACILQGLFGHRFPLMEGPSGVIWGLMLNLSAAAPSLGLSVKEVGGGIASGMLLAGIAILFIVIFNLVSFIQKLFNEMVMNVFLLLLTFQLSFIFFNGMLSIKGDGTLHLPITFFSFAVAFLVALLKIKGNKSISNFSLLIGIVVGWIFYATLFPPETSFSGTAVSSFSIFPLGTPNLQYGIIAITFLACVINLSNTVASLHSASILLKENLTNRRYRSSFFFTGMYTFFAALFGLVSYAPFASSIGFLESTQIFNRRPFFIGGGFIILIGIIPSLGLMLAKLPITVGNAVLFVAYLQLLGTFLKNVKEHHFNSVTIHRLAAPVLVGVCIMTLDPTLFTSFPSIIQPIVSNGFIVGVLISIMMELLINWNKAEIGSKMKV